MISRLGSKAWNYHGRGSVYYTKNDYDHAISDFAQAITSEPSNIYYYGDLARAYEGKKIITKP